MFGQFERSLETSNILGWLFESNFDLSKLTIVWIQLRMFPGNDRSSLTSNNRMLHVLKLIKIKIIIFKLFWKAFYLLVNFVTFKHARDRIIGYSSLFHLIFIKISVLIMWSITNKKTWKSGRGKGCPYLIHFVCLFNHFHTKPVLSLSITPPPWISFLETPLVERRLREVEAGKNDDRVKKSLL